MSPPHNVDARPDWELASSCTAADDESYGVSADALGNVYISGMTYGSLGGPNAGDTDAFLAKLIPEPGSLAAIALFGSALLRRRRPCSLSP